MAGDAFRAPIALPVDTNAPEAADSIEALRDSVLGSTQAIRAMGAMLRNLKGDSAEVVTAQNALKGKIDEATGAQARATLKLVQQGTTVDAVVQKEKKYLAQKKLLDAEFQKRAEAKAKDQTAALSGAIGAAGGPVAMLVGKFSALKSITGETSGVMGLTTLAVAGAVAAIAALAAAAVGGAYSLAKFILTAGNAARTAGLMREAWSGTASNAANLGSQVDALSSKVPTSKAALNDLAISLMKLKLGGQATVDTFNAVGQASSALGDEAGKKIQEFIDRGRLVGRMRIDPREMVEGFGNLEFGDVAGSLAKRMGVSVADARKALFEGRVKLADGAAAMREAVEKKFAGLNLRKMMDLNVLSEKLHEKLAGLTKGVDLEPLLKPLTELGKLFSDETVTGTALKQLVTTFGTGMVAGLTASIPLAKALFEGLVLGSLKAYLGYLKLKQAAKGLFGDSKLLGESDALTLAMKGGEVAAGALAIGVGSVAVVLGLMALELKGTVEGFRELGAMWDGLAKRIAGTDLKKAGGGVVDGLLGGIKSKFPEVGVVMGDLGDRIKKAFASELEIFSPSRVMYRLGEQVPAGAAGGVKAGSGDVVDASRDMAEGATAGARAGARGGSGGGAGGIGKVEVNVYLQAPAGGAAERPSPSFLAGLTKAIEDALVAKGIPVLT